MLFVGTSDGRLLRISVAKAEETTSTVEFQSRLLSQVMVVPPLVKKQEDSSNAAITRLATWPVDTKNNVEGLLIVGKTWVAMHFVRNADTCQTETKFCRICLAEGYPFCTFNSDYRCVPSLVYFFSSFASVLRKLFSTGTHWEFPKTLKTCQYVMSMN